MKRDAISVILQGVLKEDELGREMAASIMVSFCPQQLKRGAALNIVHLLSSRKSDITHLSHCVVTGCDSYLCRDTFLPWNVGLWPSRENNSMKSVGHVFLMKSVFSSNLPLKPKISATPECSALLFIVT